MKLAHIQELVKNKKYKLVVEVGKVGRKRRTRTVDATGIREARELLREFQNELDDIAHLDTSDPSFVAFSNLWMENFAMENLEPPTYENYENLVVHMNRFFKDFKLKDIKPFHIDEFFNAERRAKRASLPLKYEMLTSIFKQAVRWLIIDSKDNPMQSVPMPKY